MRLPWRHSEGRPEPASEAAQPGTGTDQDAAEEHPSHPSDDARAPAHDLGDGHDDAHSDDLPTPDPPRPAPVLGPAIAPPLTELGPTSVPPPVIVPRWIQLVLLPIALVALWALARASGSVLLILIVASTVALILSPIVRMLERARIPRGLAIFVVYMTIVAILAGIGLLLADPISTQISRFQKDVPHLVKQANKDLTNLQTWLDQHGINVHIQQQGQTALQTLQKNVLKRSGAIVSFSRDLLTQLVTISFDFVLVLVLSVYLLIYGKQIGDLARRIMPPGDGTPEDDYPLLVQRAVFGYVRGQVLFSLIMGASAAVALYIFGLLGIFPDGKHYAIFFGAFYGLMEFIPYIGPIIGPLPAVLVALFNDPLSALWLIVLFIGLQQLEGHIVAPQVFRISLRINPILVILGLLIGYQLYGIAGALVALPVAAVIRQTILYLRRHLVLEPWVVRTAAAATADADILPLGPDRCAECGGVPAPGDQFCRVCGASLEPRVTTPS